jgi:hypothetical protein
MVPTIRREINPSSLAPHHVLLFLKSVGLSRLAAAFGNCNNCSALAVRHDPLIERRAYRSRQNEDRWMHFAAAETVPTKVLALAPNNALARTFLGLAQISSRRVGAGLKGPTYNKFLGEIPNICTHGVNEARFTHLT